MGKNRLSLVIAFLLLVPTLTWASGFGVFTQGAAGLGQANAVVAHPVGPSSVYFNPALLPDISGKQIEIGTTLISADRSVDLDTGGTQDICSHYDYPSTLYYTHQVTEDFSFGLGVFFPFGLSTEWDDTYTGRYLGTLGDIVTTNINPVFAYRVNDQWSISVGATAMKLDAELEKKINQTAAYIITDLQLSGGVGGALPPLGSPLPDINQRFEGDGWGYGFNVGLLYKPFNKVSMGFTYRSHVDIQVEGKASFTNVTPILAAGFTDTGGDADIRLPAQATAGVAYQFLDALVIECGARWEDWSSTEELKISLKNPVFGQTSDTIPRDWKSTRSYMVGADYQLTNHLSLRGGYLFGENAVPSSTFEPLVPDSDAHLITVGLGWQVANWTIDSAFGYEYHESRSKSNSLGDPLGSVLAGSSVSTANGDYKSEIFLFGLSVAYNF